jgi:hypothetical protein
MPKRTNVFQEVVAIIHRHIAEGAAVEESVLLAELVSGDLREVDAVIKGKTAGYEVIVSVEANARKRPAPVGWVEEQVKKHEALPTNQLVLASQAGFTRKARRVAEEHGIPAIAPEMLSEPNSDYEVIGKMKSVWPRVASLLAKHPRLTLEAPDGTTSEGIGPGDLLILRQDGTEILNLRHIVEAILKGNFPKLMEKLGPILASVTEEMSVSFTISSEGVGRNMLVDDDSSGQAVPLGDLFLRYEAPYKAPVLHRIVKLEMEGTATIQPSLPVPLTHARLGGVDMAFGEGQIADRPALIVLTEDERGGKMTIRVRPES